MNNSGLLGILFVAIVALAVVSMTGERPDDRVLRFTKGTYSGQPDDMADPAMREVLRDRMTFQGGLNAPSLGGAGGAQGGAATEPDVRPPGATDALRERGKGQSFR
jgi:hypothetical protein